MPEEEEKSISSFGNTLHPSDSTPISSKKPEGKIKSKYILSFFHVLIYCSIGTSKSRNAALSTFKKSKDNIGSSSSISEVFLSKVKEAKKKKKTKKKKKSSKSSPGKKSAIYPYQILS